MGSIGLGGANRNYVIFSFDVIGSFNKVGGLMARVSSC